jgi:phage terminase small subunit
MPILPDERQEEFCRLRVQGKTRDEAYELAGYKPNRSNASRLTTKELIRDRIKELQMELAESYVFTVEMMARQFDEDHRLAVELKQMSAAVNASNSKAKLLGLMTERHTVNVTHNYAMMSEEELRFEIAAINAEARAIKAGVN